MDDEVERRLRRLADLLPKIRKLADISHKAIISSAIASAAWLGISPTPATAGESPSTSSYDLASPHERNKRQPRLILTLRHAVYRLALQHRSHASHASHASHRSHASHYSGAYSAPAAPPPQTAAPTAPELSGRAEATPAPQARTGIVTIKRIDRGKRTITAQVTPGQTIVLHYRDYTHVPSATGTGTTPLDVYQDQNPNRLPFRVGDRVTATWTSSQDHKTLIATKITK